MKTPSLLCRPELLAILFVFFSFYSPAWLLKNSLLFCRSVEKHFSLLPARTIGKITSHLPARWKNRLSFACLARPVGKIISHQPALPRPVQTSNSYRLMAVLIFKNVVKKSFAFLIRKRNEMKNESLVNKEICIQTPSIKIEL